MGSLAELTKVVPETTKELEAKGHFLSEWRVSVRQQVPLFESSKEGVKEGLRIWSHCHRCGESVTLSFKEDSTIKKWMGGESDEKNVIELGCKVLQAYNQAIREALRGSSEDLLTEEEKEEDEQVSKGVLAIRGAWNEHVGAEK